MEKQFPLISIITVSYNAVSTIENTILSVINQTYPNIEYIIIDGGSTDGTVDIIKKYQERISFWVSEPDEGIYDAMNKGIAIATGKWINFMNSGDMFYANDTVEKVVKSLRTSIDVLYGDTMLKFSWGVFERKALPLCMMEKHLPFSHQSSFIKMDLMKSQLYDLQYRICADYNFFYSSFKAGKIFKYKPLLVSVYEAEEGVSSVNVFALFKELAIITGKVHLFEWKLEFLLFKIRKGCADFIKKIAPDALLDYYRKRKYDKSL